MEGIRALTIKLTSHGDRARVATKDDKEKAYHQGQVDLLVPLVKAYGSDQAFRVCETAIQTYGGAGYTRDYPVEQYCRDAKIFSIYEGTNHIQAMDLVGPQARPGGRREPAGVPRRRARLRAEAQGPPDARRAHVKALGDGAGGPRRRGDALPHVVPDGQHGHGARSTPTASSR